MMIVVVVVGHAPSQYCGRPNSPGSLAILAAIRRASSANKVGCGATAFLKFKIDIRERVAVLDAR